MKCIIPCAGYGTRLEKLGENTPKSLIKIKEKPLIEYLIKSILKTDVDEIFIVTNAKFYEQFKAWVDGFSCPVKIELINDGTTSNENRIGTLRDIQLALNKFDDDFVVIFSDIIYNFELDGPYEFFKKIRAPVLVIYDLADIEAAKRHGIVILDENGKIIGNEEKPQNPKSTLAASGIYFLTKEDKTKIEKYIADGKNPEGIGYFLMDEMKNSDMFGYVFGNEYTYIDLGVPEAVERAEKVL